MSETKEAKGKLHFKGSRTKSTLIIVALLAVYVVSVHLNIRPIFTFLTALVSARATYELIHAVGGRSRVLFTVSSLFSAAYVAVVSYQIPVPKPAVILSFYMLVLLVLAVALNRTIKYIDAVMAFFGSVRMRTRSSRLRLSSVAITGSLPISSGMMPNCSRSCCCTCAMIAPTSRSALLVISAPKPMLFLSVRFSMILSRPSKAPPQMKRMFEVSMWMNS